MSRRLIDSSSAAAVGADVVALLDALHALPAVVLGNSMAGAAVVWAAAERPGAVRALVLEDPFVRDLPAGFFATAALKAALLRPWGPALWRSYYKSLYVTNRPADLDAYADALAASLSQPGRMEATRAMVWASKAPCERRLGEVKARALVLMGTKDPDFADPAAEGRHVAAAVHGELQLVEGAGHYPHAEQPEVVAAALARLAAEEPR